jgi:hypothetical protein
MTYPVMLRHHPANRDLNEASNAFPYTADTMRVRIFIVKKLSPLLFKFGSANDNFKSEYQT